MVQNISARLYACMFSTLYNAVQKVCHETMHYPVPDRKYVTRQPDRDLTFVIGDLYLNIRFSVLLSNPLSFLL